MIINNFNVTTIQTFSEKQIIEYKDYIGWISISRFCKLSEYFIVKYKSTIYFDHLKDNENFNYNLMSNKFKLIYGKLFL